MSRNLKFALAAVLGVTMFAGIPAKALAQTDVGGTIISSLDLDSVDVREALRALFKNVGASYSIAPEVQGTVTVKIQNKTFDVVLQNILKQVDSTYRIEAGVYQIIHREEIKPPTPGNDAPPTVNNKVRRRIYVRHADPQFIAALINGNSSYSLAPEVSTVNNTSQSGFGGGFGGGGFGGGGFGGGGFGGGGFGGGGFGGGGFGGGGFGGGGFGRGGGGIRGGGGGGRFGG